MPNLKLTYFDFHGGRGETARLAMFIGGIAFEDDRLTGQSRQKGRHLFFIAIEAQIVWAEGVEENHHDVRSLRWLVRRATRCCKHGEQQHLHEAVRDVWFHTVSLSPDMLAPAHPPSKPLHFGGELFRAPYR